MMLLECLLNLVLYAAIAIFVLAVLGFVLSFFIPGFPQIVPYPGSPPPQNTFISLIYLFIGLVLLINFLICAFSGSEHMLLPPLWRLH